MRANTSGRRNSRVVWPEGAGINDDPIVSCLGVQLTQLEERHHFVKAGQREVKELIDV